MQKQQVAPFGEVAVLVEDAVVREKLLPVDAVNRASRAYHAGVGQISIEPRCAHESDDVSRRSGNLLERLACCLEEPGPEEEVLRRVAGDCELREEDEVRALRFGVDQG